MLIDTDSPDLLPMERAMLRPIAERLEATARVRCMGESSAAYGAMGAPWKGQDETER
ncbi:hypothetical protein [Azospirillum sp. TSO22-1]|uniref:hypothetical protein n=1 Tax=Azospirillum sp. TSO22-1 TaxID=716789 RepID=UPI001304B53D|nr:hypothetical protein [Azospirillum sp. TSO22-1]